jgi:hypothetical protein
VQSNVPVAEATRDGMVLPECVQDALGELVGAAREGLEEYDPQAEHAAVGPCGLCPQVGVIGSDLGTRRRSMPRVRWCQVPWKFGFRFSAKALRPSR